MKKMLAVFAFLMFGSMAFAAGPVHVNFTVGCANFFGVRAGTPKKFVYGVIDRSGCPGINVVMGGFQHGNPLTIPPNVTPVDDFGIPFYGLYGFDYSLDYLVTEKLPCVFASYFGNGYGQYLLNSGSCARFDASVKMKAAVRTQPKNMGARLPVLSHNN